MEALAVAIVLLLSSPLTQLTKHKQAQNLSFSLDLVNTIRPASVFS